MRVPVMGLGMPELGVVPGRPDTGEVDGETQQVGIAEGQASGVLTKSDI